jgi:hypothetical protein
MQQLPEHVQIICTPPGSASLDTCDVCLAVVEHCACTPCTKHFVCLCTPATCRRPDHEALKLAKDCSPKQYPKQDGVTTFDLATSLYRSGNAQPGHAC